MMRTAGIALACAVALSGCAALDTSELQAAGANIVIYANHLLRAAYPAMVNTAETILRSGRAHEVEDQCLSIKEVLNLIPGV